MGQLLVRQLDDRLINALKERAAKNGRSVEAEHRAILEEVLDRDRREFIELARQLRESLAGIPQTDSADLIREERDRGYSGYGQ
jgi:plasmid stability protein